MQRLTVKIGLAILILALISGLAGFASAMFGWILPGSHLFPLQERLEQMTIVGSSTRRAERSLDLVERRINDLKSRNGTPHELTALEALGGSINRATEAIAYVPQEQVDTLLNHLIDLLQQANSELSSLSELPTTKADVFFDFQSRLQTLLITTSGRNPDSPYSESAAGDTAQISALTSSDQYICSYYPLTGAHTSVQCMECHIAGIYEGIRATCLGCHVDITPSGHYHAACDLCHTTKDWHDIIWNHNPEASKDCYSCHEWTAPLIHHEGQCSQCHVISGWMDDPIYHSQPSSCWICHGEEAPVHHFLGECSDCHTTEDWSDVQPVSLDTLSHPLVLNASHVDASCAQCHGDVRCVSCHLNDRPIDHFGWQCSTCHVTDGWTGVVFLHIPSADCYACHTETAPVDHYTGQCINCHSFTGWTDAVFNHTGFTDCTSCHSQDSGMDDAPDCVTCHVQEDTSVMLITAQGQLIQLYVDEIRNTQPRAALGVKCIDLDEGDFVTSVTAIEVEAAVEPGNEGTPS